MKKKLLHITRESLSVLLDDPLLSNQDMAALEAALVDYAQAHRVSPAPALKDRILSKVAQLNAQNEGRQPISLTAVPLLGSHLNFLDWAEAVQHIPAPDDYEGIHLHPIRIDDTVEINIAWVKEEVPTEVHFDVLESFILLEGSCECHIHTPDGQSRVVYMTQGDYIVFELGEVHDIHITSGAPAKAILQWLKLAA